MRHVPPLASIHAPPLAGGSFDSDSKENKAECIWSSNQIWRDYFVFHSTPFTQADVLTDGDEFAAAFESCVPHFELYDSVQVVLFIKIGNEKSISKPMGTSGPFPLVADYFQFQLNSLWRTNA